MYSINKVQKGTTKHATNVCQTTPLTIHCGKTVQRNSLLFLLTICTDTVWYNFLHWCISSTWLSDQSNHSFCFMQYLFAIAGRICEVFSAGQANHNDNPEYGNRGNINCFLFSFFLSSLFEDTLHKIKRCFPLIMVSCD